MKSQLVLVSQLTSRLSIRSRTAGHETLWSVSGPLDGRRLQAQVKAPLPALASIPVCSPSSVTWATRSTNHLKDIPEAQAARGNKKKRPHNSRPAWAAGHPCRPGAYKRLGVIGTFKIIELRPRFLMKQLSEPLGRGVLVQRVTVSHPAFSP